MKRKTRLLPLLLAVLITALAGCYQEPEESQVTPQTVRPDTPTAVVERRDLIYQATLLGVVTPIKLNTLSFRVSGTLTQKNAKLFDRIRTGDLLAEIDSTDLQYQLNSVQLKIQRHSYSVDSNNISYQSQVMSNILLRMSLDEAIARQEESPSTVNKNAVTKAQISYDIGLNSLKQIENMARILEMDGIDYQASYENIQRMLNNCRLTAPADGIITWSDALSEGDQAALGRILFRYVAWPDLSIKILSTQASNLLGQDNIQITLNGRDYTAYSYTAVPGDEIFAQSDIGNRALAYLAFHQETPDVNPQEQVTVAIKVDKPATLCVPRRALHSLNGIVSVNLKRADGSFESRTVTTGIESGEYVEILSGLEEGDVIAAQ